MDGELAAITGVGVVSPLGTGLEAFRDALQQGGAPGAAPWSLSEEAGLPGVAEVKGFRLEDHLETVKSYLDRTSALALAAAAMARRQAGWDLTEEESYQSGLSLGTAWGGTNSNLLFAEKLARTGPKLAPPLLFIHGYANAANSLLSIEYGIRGFNTCLAGGQASGLQAVACGADQIRLGRCRYLLAGGADALSRFVLRGYADQGLLAPESRPFAPQARGFLPGEGGVLLALEPQSQAGARALSVVKGAALVQAPERAEGYRRVMRLALAEAALRPEDVQGVLPAARGLPEEDAPEAQALLQLFGELPAPPRLYALKALTGETMGAGGPLALAAATLCLRHGWPSALPELQEPELAARFCRSAPAETVPSVILVNASSLRGEICSVVLAAPG